MIAVELLFDLKLVKRVMLLRCCIHISRFPDLYVPLPLGTSFGYHCGGWGKPPVDEVSFLN